MYYGTHAKTTTLPNRTATTPLLQNRLQTHSRKQKQTQPTATKGRMRSSTIGIIPILNYLYIFVLGMTLSRNAGLK